MKKIIYVLLSLLTCTSLYGVPQAINAGGDDKSWTLTTLSSAYRIVVSPGGDLAMTYYGSKTPDVPSLNGIVGTEVTARGGESTHATPLVEVVYHDFVRETELVYEKYEISEIDGYQTLSLYQKDRHYPFYVIQHMRVLPEYDIIEKWIELRNTGKKGGDILVENVQSGTVYLDGTMKYDLIHSGGDWGKEFQTYTAPITPGVKTIEVRQFKSYKTSGFMVRPSGESDETSGKVWFGAVAYSGNWRVDFNMIAMARVNSNRVQISGGANFWDQSLTLKPGGRYTTPKMIFGYTEEGTGGVSLNFARYTREILLPASHREKIRPVIYNSWYATELDINEEQQLKFARSAKDIGAEMFVIDDGWFREKGTDRSDLGDWTVSPRKFPNGLAPMIQKINDMGMDFGIWVEPENVNPDSELYRKHPDWIIHFPNRTKHQTRNAYTLNLAREDVYCYLYNSLRKLLRENNIKFVKWDCNKRLTNPGYPSAAPEEQREVRLRFVENMYRLIAELRREFPDVWFENCAGGGGRVDHGMLSLMDCCWVSDNSDAQDRIFLHHAYLNYFPANTMVCWVTGHNWHRQEYSVEFMYDTAMAGVLGIGYDIDEWGAEKKEIARKKVNFYKEIRETVQFGDHYRLCSPFDTNRSILQYVNKNKDESAVFVYNLAEHTVNSRMQSGTPGKTRLRGLDPDRIYDVEELGSFSGDHLMKAGISFPLNGAYRSRIYKIAVR